ncbi:MAG: hypothetical protein KKF56_00970 [Nanoarchaeota archaeon]|nr:hypothetical protein [Nanoarchaeota archaeon]
MANPNIANINVNVQRKTLKINGTRITLDSSLESAYTEPTDNRALILKYHGQRTKKKADKLTEREIDKLQSLKDTGKLEDLEVYASFPREGRQYRPYVTLYGDMNASIR